MLSKHVLTLLVFLCGICIWLSTRSIQQSLSLRTTVPITTNKDDSHQYFSFSYFDWFVPKKKKMMMISTSIPSDVTFAPPNTIRRQQGNRNSTTAKTATATATATVGMPRASPRIVLLLENGSLVRWTNEKRNVHSNSPYDIPLQLQQRYVLPMTESITTTTITVTTQNSSFPTSMPLAIVDNRL